MKSIISNIFAGTIRIHFDCNHRWMRGSICGFADSLKPQPASPGTQEPSPFNILVDDFRPQPYQGESVYFFNRLEGDRGATQR